MRRAAGFTLVELVIVIVLLAIVATISVQFVALSTRGAIDVSARQQRALQGVVISEQISRELREAFPLSIRVAGNCLEWLPIEAGTAYTDLPDGGNTIAVAPFANTPPPVDLPGRWSMVMAPLRIHSLAVPVRDQYRQPSPASTIQCLQLRLTLAPIIVSGGNGHRSGGSSWWRSLSASARVVGFYTATVVMPPHRPHSQLPPRR